MAMSGLSAIICSKKDETGGTWMTFARRALKALSQKAFALQCIIEKCSNTTL